MDSILWDSVKSLMLTEEAKKSPRLRMNRDMRTQASCPETGHDDASQRMLNALEPGTVVPVHRHPLSTETVCVLRGAVRQSLFEEVSACVSPEGYAKRAQAILDMENLDCSFVAPEAGSPKTPESDGAVRDRSLKLVEQFVVEAGSSCPMYVVPAGVWHTTEAMFQLCPFPACVVLDKMPIKDIECFCLFIYYFQETVKSIRYWKSCDQLNYHIC